jgi:MFS family permease
MGFTIFGGIYSLLLNLYLLRLGYGPTFIGLVNAAAMLGWALACLPAGALGRRWGSRRAMVIGMSITMVGCLLVPFCEIAPPGPWRGAWLMGSYLLGNVAISLYDVNSQPFLAAVSTPAERNHLFSLQAALWPLAGFAGSLLGGVLPGLFAGALGASLEEPAPYGYPLMIAAAVLGVAAAALSATRLTRDNAEVSSAASLSSPGPNAGRSRLPLALVSVLGLAMLLQGSGEGAARTFFNVYLDAALHAPTARIGVLVALAQLAAVPAALLMPAAARRWGHRNVFLWGTVGIAASLLPLALVPWWIAAGLGYMAVIVFVSLARAAVSVYLMEIMPEDRRATMSGVYTMAMGLSWSAVAAGGSHIITSQGYPVFYLAGAVLTAASAAVFGFSTRRVPRYGRST